MLHRRSFGKFLAGLGAGLFGASAPRLLQDSLPDPGPAKRTQAEVWAEEIIALAERLPPEQPEAYTIPFATWPTDIRLGVPKNWQGIAEPRLEGLLAAVDSYHEVGSRAQVQELVDRLWDHWRPRRIGLVQIPPEAPFRRDLVAKPCRLVTPRYHDDMENLQAFPLRLAYAFSCIRGLANELEHKIDDAFSYLAHAPGVTHVLECQHRPAQLWLDRRGWHVDFFFYLEADGVVRPKPAA